MMTFKLGESGNRSGRPKGSGQRQQLFNSLVAPHTEALFNTAINLALAGSEVMLRLFLERLLPLKVVIEPLDIVGTNAKETVEKLLEYIETGDLSAEEASKIASIVQKQDQLEKQQLLLEKLSLMEQKINESDKFSKLEIELKAHTTPPFN